MSRPEIERRFTFQWPTADQAHTQRKIQEMCLNLAHYLDDMLPKGDGKDIAINKLEEFLYWAQATVQRQS